MEAKTSNKSFCSNYLLLNPKQATFIDNLRLLFSSDLKNRKFIDSFHETQKNFWYRLLIFVSILAQYLLQLVVEEEPNKNYFSIWSVFLMMINAVQELIRSFTIVKEGSDYQEGWLLIVFRVIGLVVPGIPAHCPQDYVNSTRLGSPEAFLPQRRQTSTDDVALLL
ncbi:hypothetical protein QUC31_003116 [Theobroma cacao]